jgi:outer membrane protein assembly factor BamE (lipoprotein component of BamABCDE complex)
MGKTTTTKRLVRLALVGAVTMTVACTPIYRDHGYMPPEEDLAQVNIGQDTREQVVTVLGPPTAGSVQDGAAIYYVASRFRLLGAFAPEEIDRQVLAVSFAADGTVENIERFGLQDGNVVVLSRRVTTDSVRDTTFIRQLLGNLGRFDSQSVFGEG